MMCDSKTEHNYSGFFEYFQWIHFWKLIGKETDEHAFLAVSVGVSERVRESKKKRKYDPMFFFQQLKTDPLVV